jgi:hypothetical protein
VKAMCDAASDEDGMLRGGSSFSASEPEKFSWFTTGDFSAFVAHR